MGWRLAGSLVVLRDQINGMAPGRSTASDGTIGDPAHQHRASRHNPNGSGVVCALDVTDDPAHGCPIHAIAEAVRTRPHPNLAYIISNGRIAGRTTGWAWHRYTLGDRAEDVFLISGEALGNSKRVLQLEQELAKELQI